MKTVFKKQLETNKPVTEELLSKIRFKKYDNGENIKVGDIVLYAMLNRGLNKGLDKIPATDLKVIALNKNQFDLYCVDESVVGGIIGGTELPTIKLK